MKISVIAALAVSSILAAPVNAQIQQVPFVGYCGSEEAHKNVAGDDMEIIPLEKENAAGIEPVMLRGKRGVAMGVRKSGAGICVLWFHIYEGLEG